MGCHSGSLRRATGVTHDFPRLAHRRRCFGDRELHRFAGLRLVLTVFVLSFAVFSVLWIIMVAAKDHAQ
jgi:hypothetical protein